MAIAPIRFGGAYGLTVLALCAALAAEAQTTTTRTTTNPVTPVTEETLVLEKMTVTGLRESLAKGLARQKESANLKSVLSVDNIGSLPDKNVAEALSRVPGVSIQTVSGEGRFITIRGVEPGLNNVTMNGETLAASDTGGRSGRAAPLDVLSAASIGQLEVVKSITPDSRSRRTWMGSRSAARSIF
jgi:outer membrane receptor for ferrienterochelin and colicin